MEATEHRLGQSGEWVSGEGGMGEGGRERGMGGGMGREGWGEGGREGGWEGWREGERGRMGREKENEKGEGRYIEKQHDSHVHTPSHTHTCRELSSYLPHSWTSLHFAFDPKNESEPKNHTLEAFVSMETDHSGVMCFTGGPVWAMDWLPVTGW